MRNTISSNQRSNNSNDKIMAQMNQFGINRRDNVRSLEQLSYGVQSPMKDKYPASTSKEPKSFFNDQYQHTETDPQIKYQVKNKFTTSNRLIRRKSGTGNGLLESPNSLRKMATISVSNSKRLNLISTSNSKKLNPINTSNIKQLNQISVSNTETNKNLLNLQMTRKTKQALNQPFIKKWDFFGKSQEKVNNGNINAVKTLPLKVQKIDFSDSSRQIKKSNMNTLRSTKSTMRDRNLTGCNLINTIKNKSNLDIIKQMKNTDMRGKQKYIDILRQKKEEERTEKLLQNIQRHKRVILILIEKLRERVRIRKAALETDMKSPKKTSLDIADLSLDDMTSTQKIEKVTSDTARGSKEYIDNNSTEKKSNRVIRNSNGEIDSNVFIEDFDGSKKYVEKKVNFQVDKPATLKNVNLQGLKYDLGDMCKLKATDSAKISVSKLQDNNLLKHSQNLTKNDKKSSDLKKKMNMLNKAKTQRINDSKAFSSKEQSNVPNTSRSDTSNNQQVHAKNNHLDDIAEIESDYTTNQNHYDKKIDNNISLAPPKSKTDFIKVNSFRKTHSCQPEDFHNFVGSEDEKKENLQDILEDFKRNKSQNNKQNYLKNSLIIKEKSLQLSIASLSKSQRDIFAQTNILEPILERAKKDSINIHTNYKKNTHSSHNCNAFSKNAYTDLKVAERIKEDVRRHKKTLTMKDEHSDKSIKPRGDFQRNLTSPLLKKRIDNSSLTFLHKKAIEKEKIIQSRREKIKARLMNEGTMSIGTELELKRKARVLQLQEMFKCDMEKVSKIAANKVFSEEMVTYLVDCTEENREFITRTTRITDPELTKILSELLEIFNMASIQNRRKEAFLNATVRRSKQHSSKFTTQVTKNTQIQDIPDFNQITQGNEDGNNSGSVKSNSSDNSMVSFFETKVDNQYKSISKLNCVLESLEYAPISFKRKKIIRDICIRISDKTKGKVNNEMKKREYQARFFYDK